MFEMCYESGPHFHQQRFEFRILSARNQRFVHRVDHVLVIGNLVVDVGRVDGDGEAVLGPVEVDELLRHARLV